MKKIKMIAALAATPLALASCGIAAEKAQEPSTTSSSTSEAEVDTGYEPGSWADEPAEDEPTDESYTDYQVTFGETFEWEDGTSASVSKPVNYMPSSYAAGGEGYQHHVKMTVKIVNGSSLPLDASFATPTVSSGDREGDEIYDDEMGGGTMANVLPGRTVTFDVAYGVDDPDDVVAEFAPTWDHDYAYWSN